MYRRVTFSAGLVFLVSVFLFGAAYADTVYLKDEGTVKGLVVEDHHDRILLSTSEGEITYLKDNVVRIEYDDPENSFMNLGREMEDKKRWGEALSYYEEAYKINPELKGAWQAAIGVRSKLWAENTEGPIDEMAKRQDMQDAWQTKTLLDDVSRESAQKGEDLLYIGLGLRLKSMKEWVTVSGIRIREKILREKIKVGDMLVAIDGKSLRYINVETVIEYLLKPRYANATLQIRRRISLKKTKSKMSLGDHGLFVKQEYDGLTVNKITKNGPADKAGLKISDSIIEINDVPIRYVPIGEAIKLIENTTGPELNLLINRTVTISRK